MCCGWYGKLLSRRRTDCDDQNVAVLHPVVLSFLTVFACFLDFCFSAILLEVINGICFRLDESFLKVSVDDTCCFWCSVARMNCPSAAFVRSAGEEGAQSHEVVHVACKRGESAFFEPHAVHEFLAVVWIGNVTKVNFEFSAEYDYFRFLFFCNLLYHFNVFVCSGSNGVLVDVAYEHLRLNGEQVQIINACLFVIVKVCKACTFSVLKKRFNFCNGACISCEFLFFFLSKLTDRFSHLFLALVDSVKVCLRKLVVDGENIALRVNRGVCFCIFTHVLNVWIVEAADNVCNDCGFADVREELVAKTFAFACSFNESCNVHEVYACWCLLLRLED